MLNENEKKKIENHFLQMLRNSILDKDEEKKEDKSEDKKESGEFLTEKLLQTRTILLSGAVDKELAKKVINQLLVLEAISSEPIKIMIDSPGGDVDAGYAIFDMVRFIKPEVTMIGMGLVASAAALILLAVPANRRFGLPNSRYLIHQPLLGGVFQGVATDIEIEAKEIEKTREKINKLIAKETKKSLKEVESHTDRDYWLESAEALKYGLISKVIEHRSEIE